jgi:hypothetical protein
MRKVRRKSYQKNGKTEQEKYLSFKAAANRRGRYCAISFDQFCSLRLQPCTYGGGAPPEIRIGLDRKDNLTGYTIQNCVPCCGKHNFIKSQYFSYAEMLFIVKHVKGATECANMHPIRVNALPL